MEIKGDVRMSVNVFSVAYIHNFYGICSDEKFVNLSDYNFLKKENAELKEKLKGFENGDVAWQGDMDATIKQNLELKTKIKEIIEILNMNDHVENIYNYLCCLLNLRIVDECDCETCSFDCKKRLAIQDIE